MILYAITDGWSPEEVKERVDAFLEAGFIPAKDVPSSVRFAIPDITLHFVLKRNDPIE